LKFFDWALSSGDTMAVELEFVPLEPAVKDAVRRAWAGVRDKSGNTVALR
jgi:phosphate transport system substrate-binding protein